MPTYPVIPITQFYNNSADQEVRAAKIELGKGGVIDRGKIHAFNSTRKSYSISAVLKDRDTLQNFLETNRGKPFEFRYDGSNSAGLFVCKTWSWNWVVFVDTVGGVWNFSATFEQVFRPGWVSGNEGLGVLTTSILNVSGTGFISINPVGSGTLIAPILTLNGVGEIIQATIGTGTLTWPTIQSSGSGKLANKGSGAIVWPTITITGSGTVQLTHVGEGSIQTPSFEIDGTASVNLIQVGQGDLETAPIETNGSGIIYITHSGSGELVTQNISLSGFGDKILKGSGNLEINSISIQGSGTTDTEPTSWTPVELSLTRWYTMEASTLFDATSGGATPAADGVALRIEDISGNGRHAIQSDSSFAAIRKVASLNGRDSIRFDGSSDIYTDTGGAYASRWAIAVCQDDRVGVTAFVGLYTGSTSQLIFNVSGNLISTGGYTVRRDGVATTSYDKFEPFIWFCDIGSIPSPFEDKYFGAERNAPSGRYWLGHCWELIEGDQELSLADIQRLEGYLAHRHNRIERLPSDHPYKNNPPTL